MKIRLASDLQTDSIVDGEGIRTVLWTQGCAHNCPMCHNPQTHAFDAGLEVELDDVISEINKLEGQTGVTFSGGDPLYQIEPVTLLAKHIKSLGMNVWLYTGFVYEDALKLKGIDELLKYIDILVDGPFINELKSLDIPFRGSTNQRIIDVQKTLSSNQIVLVEKYMNKKDNSPLYKKDPKLFI